MSPFTRPLRNFRLNVIVRLTLLGLTMAALVLVLVYFRRNTSLLFLVGLLALQLVLLFRSVDATNRKLTQFLEFIRYSDFGSDFPESATPGKSFRELHHAFNQVLEAFRQTRAEREENLQYLNTVVQHVRVGLLSYGQEGRVELLNTAACRLLNVPRLHLLQELSESHPGLLQIIMQLEPGQRTLYEANGLQLSVHQTAVRLRGKAFQLVALHNIRPELQQKELEAWQNLARVLRHEIMNSMTPIHSLAANLEELVEHDLQVPAENEEALQDVKESVRIIRSRSQGLINFINAYQHFTTLPKPQFSVVKVADLLQHVLQLLQHELRQVRAEASCTVEPPSLQLSADQDLLEMVLINLVKNALDAHGFVRAETNAAGRPPGCAAARSDHGYRQRAGYYSGSARSDIYPVLHYQGQRVRNRAEPVPADHAAAQRLYLGQLGAG